MNEHDVIARLSALPDRDLELRVDVDKVINSVKLRRKRGRTVAGAVLATAGLVVGLVVATNQLNRTTPAASNAWTLHSPDIKGADLKAIAPIGHSDVWSVGSVQPTSTESPGLATHWDGARWTRYTFSKGSELSDVSAVASDDVWAVGVRTTVRDDHSRDRKPLAWHWAGNSWQEFPVPASEGFAELHAVAAVSAGDVWAVGSAWTGDTSSRTFIVHWDGHAWQEVTTPQISGATLDGIHAVSAKDIWAVGRATAGQEKQPLSLHWDGRQWSVIPVGTGSGALFGVVALAPDDVWAAGGDRLVHWDGRSWQSVPVPGATALTTVAPDGTGGIVAAGQDTCKIPCAIKDVRDLPHMLVVRRTGGEWKLIDPPVDSIGSIQRLNTTPGGGAIWSVGYASGDQVSVVASISFTPGRRGR